MPSHISPAEIQFVEQAIQSGQTGGVSQDLMRRYQEHIAQNPPGGPADTDDVLFTGSNAPSSQTAFSPTGGATSGVNLNTPTSSQTSARRGFTPTTGAILLLSDGRIVRVNRTLVGGGVGAEVLGNDPFNQRNIGIGRNQLSGPGNIVVREVQPSELDASGNLKSAGGADVATLEGTATGTPFTDFQNRIGGQQLDPTTTTPNAADAIVTLARRSPTGEPGFDETEGGGLPRVIPEAADPATIVPQEPPLTEQEINRINAENNLTTPEFGRFQTFVNRLGIPAFGGGFGDRAVRRNFDTASRVFDLSQSAPIRELQGFGVGDEPGTFGNFIEGLVPGQVLQQSSQRAGDILRQLYGAGGAGRALAGAQFGVLSRDPDTDQPAFQEGFGQQTQRDVIGLGLRSRFGGLAARNIASALPRFQRQYTDQVARGEISPDTPFLDFVINRFGPGLAASFAQ